MSPWDGDTAWWLVRGKDQSLPLCTPVPGSAGVSEPFVGAEETMVGFGLSVLAVGALLALQ